MQDLIRHLPAVIYEYAFYPDGNHRFHFVSERSVEMLGLDPGQLIADPGVLTSIAVLEDQRLLSQAFSRDARVGQPVVARIRHPKAEVVKRVEIRYSDHIRENRVVIRRGFICEKTDTESGYDHGVYPYDELFEKL